VDQANKADLKPPPIARCPHCGNETPHELLNQSGYSVQFWNENTNHLGYEFKWWALLKCKTCEGMSLWHDFWNEADQTWEVALLYPHRLRAPAEVPAAVARAFDEVIAARSIAPGLAAVGIRRVLEGIAHDQNAAGRVLRDQIRWLGDEGIIPTQLAEMMDVSRLLGNMGAHYAPDMNITLEDVETLTEFVLALFEYIYVAPAKVEAFRRSVEARKA
jgi:hypothetical protein